MIQFSIRNEEEKSSSERALTPTCNNTKLSHFIVSYYDFLIYWQPDHIIATAVTKITADCEHLIRFDLLFFLLAS